MPTYKYKSKSFDGETTESIHIANSKDDVVAMIRQKKQIPITIEEFVKKESIGQIPLLVGSGVKAKDIFIFCRQFYTMLNAGISIVVCLDILKRQTENKKLRETIENVYEEMQKGRILSEAMKEHRAVFPDLFLNMIEAGEASGNLDVIMDRMAIHFEKEYKINNKIKVAMMYPIILGTVAIGVVIFLLIVVMPIFVSMFEGSGTKLPVPTKIVLAISDALQMFWYLFLGGIVGIIFTFKCFLSTNNGIYALDNLKLRLPIIKDIVVKVTTSRFSRTLSVLLSSSVPLLESLNIASKVSGNKVVENIIKDCMYEVQRGSTLSKPIKKSGIFPPILESMVEIGEESGALDEILKRAADFYDDEVEVSIQKMTALMEPIMLIVMAFLIGSIVVAMIMPMFDIINTI